jgi:hypothetical protein
MRKQRCQNSALTGNGHNKWQAVLCSQSARAPAGFSCDVQEVQDEEPLCEVQVTPQRTFLLSQSVRMSSGHKTWRRWRREFTLRSPDDVTQTDLTSGCLSIIFGALLRPLNVLYQQTKVQRPPPVGVFIRHGTTPTLCFRKFWSRTSIRTEPVCLVFAVSTIQNLGTTLH